MEETKITKETDYDGLIEDLIQKIDNEKALFNLRYQISLCFFSSVLSGFPVKNQAEDAE